MRSNFWISHKTLNRICLTLLLLMLSGCGNGETAVKDLAQLRWNALIDGDLRTVYQQHTDAFQETVSLRSFRKQIKGIGLWNQAQVEAVECDPQGKRCNAQVRVTVSMKMRGLPKPVETSDLVRETWVKTGFFSDWRYVKN